MKPQSHPVTFTTLRESEFPQRIIENGAGVRASVLANGCVQTISVGHHLVNLFIGQPLGGGPMRLLIRKHDGETVTYTEAIGPASEADVAVSGNAFRWSGAWDALRYTVDLVLHEALTAWAWVVTLDGCESAAGRYDAVLVQDVGLAGRGQVQNNEAYTSQYLDHQVLDHAALGPVVMARQNLPQHEGHHPWLAHACVPGSAGVLTDAFDFFGPAHRAGGAAAMAEAARIDTRCRQYEFACHTLQSRPVVLGESGGETIGFVARYVEDHPAASSADDLALLDGLDDLSGWQGRGEFMSFTDRPRPGLHGRPVNGRRLDEATLGELFGDERRHVETLDGQLASFFGEDGQHVVLPHKELSVERRHAHILMAGRERLPGGETLCSTGYMSGVFASHVCLGNTSFNKLIGVSRDPLNLSACNGLRLAVRLPGGGGWQQLGTPSAFDMGVDDCVWVYELESGQRLSVTASAKHSTAGGPALEWKVKIAGEPLDIRLTAHLALGDREHDQPGQVTLDPAAGTVTLTPSAGLIHERYPAASWLIAFDDAPAALGGDELLYEDGRRRGLPYVVAEARGCKTFGWRISGTLGDVAGGQDSLHDRVAIDERSGVPTLEHDRAGGVARLSDALPWFAQNAAIHLTAPHGIEQYGGAAWGVRDVCQGPVEWLLGVGEYATAARILEDVFTHQYEGRGDWPQWYMHPPFETIQSDHCHGDVAVWPIIATVRYLEATGDFSLLDKEVAFTADRGFAITRRSATIRAHLDLAVEKLRGRFVPGTALLRFGDGDWNDSLQPARPTMREKMVSTWTVGLFHEALRRYAEVLRRSGGEGDAEAARRHDATADAMRDDFERYLMPDGVTAGLYLHDDDASQAKALLHPRDHDTGVRYRLLPMIRGIISGMFTPEEAQRHLALIEEHLLAPDGARLMDRPPRYRGGPTEHFQRAESASFFGREVGLMYVHAHLRYAEAMMRLGKADAAYKALLTVNPIGLKETVSNALPRQANCYFSSSDAAFMNRADAAERYDALKRGEVRVHGGWRVYSSGPGIYIGLVLRQWLGLRRHFDEFIIDPVLPTRLDGLRATLTLEGVDAAVTFRVGPRGYGASSVRVGDVELESLGREANPYREGGLRFGYDAFIDALRSSASGEVVVTVA